MRVPSFALRGKREQRHYRLRTDEPPRGFRRGNGDLRQLHCSGIDDHGTIPESHQTAVAQIAVRNRHDVGARNQVDAGRGAYRLQCRPDRIGGRMSYSAHTSVGIARGHHECGKI